jgi:nucleotide-binding universal stress UspA family protein
MKKILAPTDFSDAARAACTYAMKLAESTGSKLVLFHAFNVPIPATEAPIVLITEEDLSRENLKSLNSFAEELLADTKCKVEVECIVGSGFAVDEVPAVADREKIDLVVMGVSGAGMVKEYLIGSSTLGVMSNSDCPLLVVPKEAEWQSIRKAGFAFDYKDVASHKMLDRLRAFVKAVGCELDVFNIEKADEKVTLDKAIAGVRLEDALKDIPHSLHFPKSEELLGGINEYVDTNNIDVLIMVPKRLGIFDRLFNRSNTRKMVFHSNKPLLILKD